MAKALGLSAKQIEMVLVDEPKGVVRLEIDPGEVEDLAENIREVGLLQPILVRPQKDRFEVVFGHRRFLAHKFLRAEKIGCIVRALSDMECAVMRGTENIQRVNLSPLEQAAIFSDLHNEHGLSHEEVGKKMGKSAGVVRRRLDLLRMPPQLQKAIHSKQISCGVGEELWSIGDTEGIDYYLSFAVEHGVTVAVARAWAKDWKDTHRRAESDVDRGGGVVNPLEPRPTYLPCDICRGPEEVKDMQILHCCRSCTKKIMAVVEGSQT